MRISKGLAGHWQVWRDGKQIYDFDDRRVLLNWLLTDQEELGWVNLTAEDLAELMSGEAGAR